METKRALITGITAQDGLYLVELLLDQGYTVGMVRRASKDNFERLEGFGIASSSGKPTCWTSFR